MSNVIHKKCDYPVEHKGVVEECGLPVPNDVPTVFALSPKTYKADLCDLHHRALASAIASFVDVSTASRAVVSTTPQGRKILRGKGGREFTTADVREWLILKGRLDPTRRGGRVPDAAIEEYKQLVK